MNVLLRALRFAAFAALLLLVACTGTSSFQAPRLLITTFGTGSTASVALVVDNGPQGSGDRLEFLPASVRLLAGQAVALDFRDRAGLRDEVVLLLNEGANQFSLEFLNTAAIDPAAPGAFARSREPLPLNALLAAVAADLTNLCLTEVQVTRDGRYAALLNGGVAAAGPACPASVTDAPELFIVDLTGVDAALSISPSAELLPVRPYLDQAILDDEDQLFYLVGGIGSSAELWSVPLPPSASLPDGALVGTFSGSGSNFPLDLSAGPEGMLALRTASIQLLLEDGQNVTAATPATPVRFIRDPYVTELQQVLVLRSAGYSVHRNAADSTPVTGSLSGVTDATVDPERLYAYFLSAGVISIVDILDLSDSDGAASPRPVTSRIPELTAPAGLISWIASALPVASP